VKNKDIHEEHPSLEENKHGHGDIEPVIVRILSPHEELANQMKKNGIDCEALPSGSHPLERKPYYSQLFPMTPKLVTNKGLIKIKGKNIDLVQMLQRD
jgi:hypothetical protein